MKKGPSFPEPIPEVAMFSAYEIHLGTQRDSIVDHIEHIRQLDLSVEADLSRVLHESRAVLGALALYREGLSRAAAYRYATTHRAA